MKETSRASFVQEAEHLRKKITEGKGEPEHNYSTPDFLWWEPSDEDRLKNLEKILSLDYLWVLRSR